MNGYPENTAVPGEGRLLRVTARGNLRICGAERSDLDVRARPGSLEVHESAGEVEVRLDADGEVVMPAEWQLDVIEVHGDASIREVKPGLRVGRVVGDLTASTVGGITLECVSGDVTVGRVTGDCRLGQVGGDAKIMRVEGQLEADSIAGDLTFEHAGSDVDVNVGSDIQGSMTPQPGRMYRLRAGGDVTLVLPEHCDLTIEARSAGGPPRLELRQPVVVETLDGGQKLVLGDGNAKAEVAAGGRITVRQAAARSEGTYWSLDEEAARLAEDIGRLLEERMATLASELSERLAHLGTTLPKMLVGAGVSEREAERVVRQTEQSLERAVERVRRQTARTIARLERRWAQRERKAAWDDARERAPSSQPPRWASAKGGGKEPAVRSPTAEQLMVLRLVEAKKITAAEAEQLLQALEGAGPSSQVGE